MLNPLRPAIGCCAALSAPSSSSRIIRPSSWMGPKRSREGTTTGLLKRRRVSQFPAAEPNTTASVAIPDAQEPAEKIKQSAPLSDLPCHAPWLIVGLGNPGDQYQRTRHNIGFMLVDELARLEGINCRKLEKSAAVGHGEIEGCQVVLIKPVTFMNNSGDSVSALAKQYKVPVSQILVITDDLDQPTAGIKLKPKGGHGGHNGLRSIIALCQSSHFPRLKIGIGRPPVGVPVPTYVLQDFNKDEQGAIDEAIVKGLVIVRSILAVGLERALSGVRK